jgi:hypothetical protein
MRIIADGYTDLLKGREKIIELQKLHVDDSREKISALEKVLAKPFEIEDQEALERWQDENKGSGDRWQSKIERNKTAITVLGIILLVSTVAIARFLFSPSEFTDEFLSVLLVCFGFPIGLLYLGFLLALFIMWAQNKSLIRRGPKTTRKPNIRPIEFPYLADWLDLETRWWKKLRTAPEPTEHEYGDEGEERLVSKLAYILPNDHYCIKKLMVGNRLDADVVVVGPSGIWILESKYINGTIRVRNGSWSKTKRYFEDGVYKTDEVKFDSFENQWLREKRAVERATKGILPENLGSNNPLIKGGLAFTHPDTSLDFDYSMDLEFKNTSQWVKEISAAQENAFLTDDQVLHLVDALLDFSGKQRGTTSISAADLAEDIYKGTSSSLEGVLKYHGLIEMTPQEKRIQDRIREYEESREQKESIWER